MNLTALSKPILLYTGFLAGLTVGVVQFATDSGIPVLFAGLGGITLAVLSVGSTGPVDGGSFEHAEGLDAQGGWARTNLDTPVSIPLLCYGLGVALWSFLVLAIVHDLLG